MSDNITVNQAWDELLMLGISEQTLRTVTNINGYSLESLEDILFSEFGYRSFEQFNQEADDTPDNCRICDEPITEHQEFAANDRAAHIKCLTGKEV